MIFYIGFYSISSCGYRLINWRFHEYWFRYSIFIYFTFSFLFLISVSYHAKCSDWYTSNFICKHVLIDTRAILYVRDAAATSKLLAREDVDVFKDTYQLKVVLFIRFKGKFFISCSFVYTLLNKTLYDSFFILILAKKIYSQTYISL